MHTRGGRGSGPHDPSTILVSGDLHGDPQHTLYAFQTAFQAGADAIVQVGDFGYWEHMNGGDAFLDLCSHLATENDLPLYWVDGNHENHTWLRRIYGPGGARHKPTPEGFWEIRPGVYYVPRGTRWVWNDVHLMGLGGAYCVAPETKVLTTDLIWVEAGSLVPDDKLIAFDEDLNLPRGKNMTLQESKVESTGRNVLPCYRIKTDRGETVVSAEHLMVWKPSATDRRARRWKAAAEISPGTAVQWMTTPWDVETSRDAGYIAGIFDGEGWIDHTRISFAQNPGLVMEKMLALLEQRGFTISKARQARDAYCERVDICGGKWESLRLLGSTRPERLLDKARVLWDGKEIIGKGKETVPGKAWATVLEVEYLGPREVVTLKTSTRTFIADGFAAHNSVDKFHRLREENKRRRSHYEANGYRAKVGAPTVPYDPEKFQSWWPEEELTDEDMTRALADTTPIDVLFTHDKPRASNPRWNRKDLPECWPNQDKIQTVVNTLKPKLLVHGHLHYRYTDEVRCGDDGRTTRVEGLSCNVDARMDPRDDDPTTSWLLLQLKAPEEDIDSPNTVE